MRKNIITYYFIEMPSFEELRRFTNPGVKLPKSLQVLNQRKNIQKKVQKKVQKNVQKKVAIKPQNVKLNLEKKTNLVKKPSFSLQTKSKKSGAGMKLKLA